MSPNAGGDRFKKLRNKTEGGSDRTRFFSKKILSIENAPTKGRGMECVIRGDGTLLLLIRSHVELRIFFALQAESFLLDQAASEAEGTLQAETPAVWYPQRGFHGLQCRPFPRARCPALEAVTGSFPACPQRPLPW